MINFREIRETRDWTLFLDRDGVINERLPGLYINKMQDLRLLPGVTDALRTFHDIFRYIIIVTNQQGIGKGLMTEDELETVHAYMLELIRSSGGRIDHVFYSAALASDGHPDRKPGTGMALKAQSLFPDIDFSRSVMVGDGEGDVLFGQALGMKTVWIPSTDPKPDFSIEPDLCCSSLKCFAEKF
jgi:histidinol-phosphate phosphatase family protein